MWVYELGNSVGNDVGKLVGIAVGKLFGILVGKAVGDDVGVRVGIVVGKATSSDVGPRSKRDRSYTLSKTGATYGARWSHRYNRVAPQMRQGEATHEPKWSHK